MNKLLTLLLLSIIYLGCQNKMNCNLDNEILKTNDSILLSIKSDTILTQFIRKMEEPHLESSENEIYRFMILGPWGSNQIYRLTKKSDNIILTSKKYWGEENDIRIDSLGQEANRIIKKEDWAEIKNALNKLHFWSLPVRINDDHYLDGTGYIIEGYSPIKNRCTRKNYHVTARTSPHDTTLYKAVFAKVVNLTLK